MQRDHEYAQSWARDLQQQAKSRRAQRHNEGLQEIPESQRTGFDIGDAVWMYIPLVKQGLSRKLAHLWHGPFRVVEKDEEFRCKLKLDGVPYKFYPWVHVSRLKPRMKFPDRPDGELEDVEVPEDDGFDAALLPEDSWEPDEAAGEYEVDKILDVRWVKHTRQGKRMKEYQVLWKGYDESTWEPVRNLKCGALLYEFDRSSRAKTRLQAMQLSEKADELDGVHDQLASQ